MSDIGSVRTYAVIPAAGSGQRFGSSPPKQYALICDKPLIYHTISAFLRIQWIDKIIVISDEENRNLMQEIVESTDNQNRIELVIGSTTRHRSIAKGIDLIGESDCPLPDAVVIHDGARPLIDENHLKQLVSSALEFGASGIICKLTSTVLMVSEDHFLDRALNRNKLFASETPQAFRYQYIKEAYNQCSQNDYEFNTECLDLVQRYTSSRVKLIEANASEYFKVTFKKDVFGAEALIRERKTILVESDGQTESHLLSELLDKLKQSFRQVRVLNDLKSSRISSSDTSVVFISITSCNSWKDISDKYQPKCHSLIRVIIDCNHIIDSYSKKLRIWAQNQSNVVKNLFIIHINYEELIQTKNKMIDTILYLSMRTPFEMNGIVLFL